MAFTINEEQGVYVVRVFGTETRGELALPLAQIISERRRSPRQPIVFDRSALIESAVDLTELLEFLLYLERQRELFVNGHLYFVHRPEAHPAHLREVFEATAALRSLHWLHISQDAAAALRAAREAT